jgi:hypothetical protein
MLGSYQLTRDGATGDPQQVMPLTSTVWLAGRKVGSKEDRLGSDTGMYNTRKYYPVRG